MLRSCIVATAVLAALAVATVPAKAQVLRLPSSPITINKQSDAPRSRFEQSNLPVPAGRFGTSEPLNRPCYAGMLTEPCSTPGPSVKIELPRLRVKK